MHFIENLRQAYISLSSNKLRSILTMLGIIMGVFSVVAIMAISNAAQSYMTTQFNKMGANMVYLQYRSSYEHERDMMTLKDLDLLLEGIPEIEYAAAASYQYSDVGVVNESKEATIYGVTSEYPKFQEISFDAGRFINQEDLLGKHKVVVVTDKFANYYYDRSDIVGETITLMNYYGSIAKFYVVGVMDTDDELFADMVSFEDYPATIYIPYSTAAEFYDSEAADYIQVSFLEGSDITKGAKQMIKLMEFVHQNKDVYMTESVQDIQKQVDDVLGVISMILLVIAAITLVVGGIGIINILLVSVTERIREIGLRKAIGARKKDIVLQFLTESILLTAFGGSIGIIIGLILGGIISAYIKIPPIVDLKTILLALGGSIMLGIIFGVYPAKKAADLDPIDALRYE